jgi:hypothetical protein
MTTDTTHADHGIGLYYRFEPSCPHCQRDMDDDDRFYREVVARAAREEVRYLEQRGPATRGMIDDERAEAELRKKLLTLADGDAHVMPDNCNAVMAQRPGIVACSAAYWDGTPAERLANMRNALGISFRPPISDSALSASPADDRKWGTSSRDQPALAPDGVYWMPEAEGGHDIRRQPPRQRDVDPAVAAAVAVTDQRNLNLWFERKPNINVQPMFTFHLAAGFVIGRLTLGAANPPLQYSTDRSDAAMTGERYVRLVDGATDLVPLRGGHVDAGVHDAIYDQLGPNARGFLTTYSEHWGRMDDFLCMFDIGPPGVRLMVSYGIALAAAEAACFG